MIIINNNKNKLIMNKLRFFQLNFLILHPENKNSIYETNR